MMMRLIYAALAISGVLSNPSAAAEADFAGTWSGRFDIHFPDGRVINDSAWLVLQQSGDKVTGTAGPQADAQAPIREAAASGSQLRFVVDSTPGKTLQFVLSRDGERLAGEAKGHIGNDLVRVVVDATRQTGTVAIPTDALHEKMLALDSAMFDSFNKCSDPAELQKHAAFFADDVEFYHDLGGLTRGADEVMANTKKNVCGKFRRELDRESFRAFPIPGFGALTMGTHRFCHTPTTCEGAAEFTSVWRERDGVWQITRALSYAHRSLN
jgi:hypothetical protein